ncbi:MAG: carboxymethylenebutenolidase [Actinomycetota bacterium]|nr:carboxymethylenebutenolidase [Actinomycetota bacterium]
MAMREYLIGEVTQDYADGLMTRREATRRLGLLAVSTSAAAALLAACGSGGGTASDTQSSSPPATSKPGGTTAAARADIVRFKGPSGELQAAWAGAPAPKAAVLVIHENRGLTPHFHDLVRRFAGQGYSALCVDLLSPEGGTASLKDPAAAPTALANAPVGRLLGDLRAGIDELQRRVPGKKVGAVGFCFGGGMVWNLLNVGEARLASAVPFYGTPPDNPDFSKTKAAVLAMYGGLDERVTPTRDEAEAALRQAGLTYEIRVFPGANHAFFNDTNPQRYHAKAAAEAWTALLAWFAKYLS